MSIDTTLHAPMRVMGIQASTPLAQVHETLNHLWTQWQDHKAARLPSFTLTVYCVYEYDDAQPDQVRITIGRLVAQDAIMPDFARDTTLLAQDYLRFDVPENEMSSVFETWQHIEESNLQRSFTIDFETYPVDGLPRIYVGVQAAVESAL